MDWSLAQTLLLVSVAGTHKIDLAVLLSQNFYLHRIMLPRKFQVQFCLLTHGYNLMFCHILISKHCKLCRTQVMYNVLFHQGLLQFLEHCFLSSCSALARKQVAFVILFSSCKKSNLLAFLQCLKLVKLQCLQQYTVQICKHQLQQLPFLSNFSLMFKHWLCTTYSRCFFSNL